MKARDTKMAAIDDRIAKEGRKGTLVDLEDAFAEERAKNFAKKTERSTEWAREQRAQEKERPGGRTKARPVAPGVRMVRNCLPTRDALQTGTPAIGWGRNAKGEKISDGGEQESRPRTPGAPAVIGPCRQRETRDEYHMRSALNVSLGPTWRQIRSRL